MGVVNKEGKRFRVERYLTSLRGMAQEMELKEERILKLRSLAEGLRSAMHERVSGGVKRDLADVEHELELLTEEYAADLSRYASEIAEGYRICPIADTSRYVCWLHWVEGRTWREVANKVDYSCEYVKRELCDQGVIGIYEDMPSHWRSGSPE